MNLARACHPSMGASCPRFLAVVLCCITAVSSDPALPVRSDRDLHTALVDSRISHAELLEDIVINNEV